MTREQAIPHILYCVDDALADRSLSDMPANARLVGWQCGFEPLFVAVWSHLSDTQGNLDRIDDNDAVEIATDLLDEEKWFATDLLREHREPDYII